MPAYMRCAYRCDKEATVWEGDESREALAKVREVVGTKTYVIFIPTLDIFRV